MPESPSHLHTPVGQRRRVDDHDDSVSFHTPAGQIRGPILFPPALRVVSSNSPDLGDRVENTLFEEEFEEAIPRRLDV